MVHYKLNVQLVLLSLFFALNSCTNALPRNQQKYEVFDSVRSAEQAAEKAEVIANSMRDELEKAKLMLEKAEALEARISNMEKHCNALVSRIPKQKKIKVVSVPAAQQTDASSQASSIGTKTPATSTIPEYSKSDAPS